MRVFRGLKIGVSAVSSFNNDSGGGKPQIDGFAKTDHARGLHFFVKPLLRQPVEILGNLVGPQKGNPPVRV